MIISFCKPAKMDILGVTWLGDNKTRNDEKRENGGVLKRH